MSGARAGRQPSGTEVGGQAPGAAEAQGHRPNATAEGRGRGGTVSGFMPPAYPYARLDGLRAEAAKLEGGAVDLSVGNPCDPPSPAVLSVLGAPTGPESDEAVRSYPSSAGSVAARRAIADWAERRFGVELDIGQIALCIGTKEFVAGLPAWLHLRDPSRDTVLYPELAYPTYEMGAVLAGLRAVPVPVGPGFRLRLDDEAIAPSDAERALVLWVNSPGNPAGQLEDLGAAAAWGREHGVLVASDECYAELTWDGPPRSILQHPGPEGSFSGVLAVHSLSKRSNLAGLRFGWYAGDPSVVSFVREVRQHAGFMVPGPVQRAGTAALMDEAHASLQRERYQERLGRLREILCSAGADAPMPGGGIYIWAPAPGGDAWGFATRLAKQAGLVVSPGEFYGAAGREHVRVAAVAPMERLELVASRLRSAS